MSATTLLSLGTILTIVAAIVTFIYGLNHHLPSSTRATLEVVAGALWMMGSAATLGALIPVRGVEFFDVLFVVLIIGGCISLITGIFHRGQLSSANISSQPLSELKAEQPL